MAKENNEIKFQLQKINTEQFAIFEENYSPKKEINLANNIEFKVDVEKMEIGVFLELNFSQNKKTFLKILVNCHFKIEETSWKCFENEEEAKITIPKMFLTHLLTISIGTVRGILYTKTEDTTPSKVLLPLLNVSETVKENISIDIQDNTESK